MIDGLKLTRSILNTKCIIPTSDSKPMLSFYAETHRILLKYVSHFVKDDCTPLQLLRRYLEVCDNNEAENVVTRRMMLIGELRQLILFSLDKAHGEQRKLMKYYHAVLHLIELVNRKGVSYFARINEWLNINFRADDEDLFTHAYRGNFGILVVFYPEMEEAVESYLELGKLAKHSIITDYDSMFKEWRCKYISVIPDDFLAFFDGKATCNANWLEDLCYRLMYVNRKEGALITDKEDFLPFVESENDEFSMILNEEFSMVRNRAVDWLNLVLQFIVDPGSLAELTTSFRNIFVSLFDQDKFLALEYIAYTSEAQAHFDDLINKIDLNATSMEILIRHAFRYKIEPKSLLQKYTHKLATQCDLLSLARFICQYGTGYSEMTEELVKFCISNFKLIRGYFTESFSKSPFGMFLTIYFKLLNDRAISVSDGLLLLDSPFSQSRLAEIFDAIFAIENPSSEVICRCIQIILRAEETNDSLGFDYTAYKAKILKILSGKRVNLSCE